MNFAEEKGEPMLPATVRCEAGLARPASHAVYGCWPRADAS